MAITIGAPPTGSKRRMDWIDCLRGVAITMLVIFHVVFGMHAAGLFTNAVFDIWGPVGELIRMPLMMFVAGMFVRQSMAKGPHAYFQGKLRRIVYPFFLWSWIYMLCRIVVPGTNNPLVWSDLLEIVWDPESHTWFLRNLAIYYVAIFFLLRQGWAVTIGAALLVSVPIQFLLGPFNRGTNELLNLFIFFVAGAVFMTWLRQRRIVVNGWAAAAIVCAGLAAPVMVYEALGKVQYLPRSIPPSFLGIAAAILLTAAVIRVEAVRRLLGYLGRRSLEIYLLHVLAASGTRIILDRFLGIENTAQIFWSTLAVALGGPVLVSMIVGRFNIPFVFEWPKPGFRRRTTDAPAAMSPAPPAGMPAPTFKPD